MNTIDFINGRWGHALHAETFCKKKADKLAHQIKDKMLKRRRYTVLVHSSKPIVAGDLIAYEAARGKVLARVVDVNWFNDPRDMAKLEITVEDKDFL